MPDAAHYFSYDLALSATGDLLVADGLEESKQRVLRRLLTNIRDYLWQPGYGAGLPSYIGQLLDEAELGALIKAQMYLEASVSHDPEPVVTLRAIPNGISAQIRYTVAATGQGAYLNFDVTPDNG
ncbi:phage tail protein [Tundrisphaera sp. TA3]|uniref:phage tail protein n=1 Tax=Tundrisphaera sp. TA3 TaxID=3435775 RepID=UPI003EC0B982